MKRHVVMQLSEKRADLTIAHATDAVPGPDQIAVRVRAVAVNPFDRYIQAMGDVIAGYLTYPVILGSDVAGEVVGVGDAVTRFRIGDRVLGHAAGLEKSRNNPAEGAFQERVLLLDHMASPIPDHLSFEQAAVLPLGLSTAACGLFQKDFLGLSAPQLNPGSTGEVIIVWGGSTSVGSNAIQLARAAGYEVVTTCSPRNNDYVMKLGAKHVFDYGALDVERRIANLLHGRRVAGAIAIGKGAAAACMNILATCEGKRFVAQVTPATSFDDVKPGPGRWRSLLPAVAKMIRGKLALSVRARRKGITTRMVWGGALVDNDIGPMIYKTFLPEVLANGSYLAMPAPDVVGHGLEYVPTAMERQRRGVSARKLVVTL